MVHRSTPTRSPEPDAPLTRLAFALSAAVVIARLTMLETLRNPLDVYPGSDGIPRGPGAATGLVLDLLGCLPALLVLARRATDPAYALRGSRSFLPLAGLSVWALASALWAGDKFAAAVSAFHWLAASALLWSTMQIVRGGKLLRLSAAACFGLLLIQLGQGFYYRYVEHPELRHQWETGKDEILRQRGWEPGSFHAAQFEKRIAGREIMGFTSSENSYGAVIVLLTFVAAGVLMQRLTDRDKLAWAAPPAAAVLLSVVMILHLQSRTADATPVLGAIALAGVWVFRARLARSPRRAFAIGVGIVVLGAAAVIGHGVYHGTLPTDSLAFRWNYWTASARLFARHPLLGVGWENFGPRYLVVRLPVAAEEIKDPHNFVVRFATELGAVGFLLLMGWIALLAWDLTAGARGAAGDDHDGADTEADREEIPPIKSIGPGAERLRPSATAALTTIIAIGAGGVLLNALASVDWAQSAGFVALEVLRRVGFLCLFVVGAAAVALRSAERQELDRRPAPWVLYGLLVALGLFLVHNLVDFSLFEPGPMTLFMFGCGAALGARSSPKPAAARRAGAAWGTLAAASVAWLVAAGALAAPVLVAEQAATDGDDALRVRTPERAADDFERALAAVPYNADYAFRAGRALLYADDPRRYTGRVFDLLDRAVAINPTRPEYWLSRADSEALRPVPDAARVRAGYDQALRLDPNSVQTRLDYAALLGRLGDPAGSREQYAEALRYDALLSRDEPKRLSPAKLEDVRRAMAELDASRRRPAD